LIQPSKFELNRIIQILEFQFPGVATDFLQDIFINISRKTGRIREIYREIDGKKVLLFSLRTSDGRMLPTFIGGLLIIQTGYDKNRIFIDDEAIPFIKKGKSVYCKHVTKIDDNIVPNSEVFILDNANNYLATGIAIQPSYAVLQLNLGVAVKNKHYQ